MAIILSLWSKIPNLKSMKYLTAIVVFYFLISCQNDQSLQKKYYKATDSKNVALLALTIHKDRFYGQYEVQYAGHVKDSGEVRGVIKGDTLNGRFKYISYVGSKELKPFLLLKKDETLKLGNGAIGSFLQIPYYTPESIEFRDSSFQFYEIDLAAAKKLNLIKD